MTAVVKLKPLDVGQADLESTRPIKRISIQNSIVERFVECFVNYFKIFDFSRDEDPTCRL